MTGNAGSIKEALKSTDALEFYYNDTILEQIILDIAAYGQSMSQQAEPDEIDNIYAVSLVFTQAKIDRAEIGSVLSILTASSEWEAFGLAYEKAAIDYKDYQLSSKNIMLIKP